MVKVKRLFSGFSIPGWIFLGWAALGELHQVSFVWELWGKIVHFLEAHFFLDLVIGFAWLFAYVAWTDIKPHMPRWARLPKTLHERVHEVETEQIPKLAQEHIEIGRRLGGVDAEFRKRLGLVEMGWSEAVSKLESLTEEYGVLRKRIQGAEARLDEHRPWISDLERTLTATRQGMSNLSRDFHGNLLFIAEITILISEARQAKEYLQRIKALYPESTASKQPFSERWWQQGPSGETPLLVLEWAAFQKDHISHCESFASLFQVSRSEVVHGGLDSCLTWDSQNSMATCTTHLNSQHAKLHALRQDRAIKFEALVSPGTTIS